MKPIRQGFHSHDASQVSTGIVGFSFHVSKMSSAQQYFCNIAHSDISEKNPRGLPHHSEQLDYRFHLIQAIPNCNKNHPNEKWIGHSGWCEEHIIKWACRRETEPQVLIYDHFMLNAIHVECLRPFCHSTIGKLCLPSWLKPSPSHFFKVVHS